MKTPLFLGVGQHPGMVGQHKTEWWVNLEQNLHKCTYCLQVAVISELQNMKYFIWLRGFYFSLVLFLYSQDKY